MQEIPPHLQLHFLKRAGKGFITAEASGQAKLHRVNCNNFDTISAKIARMKFFDTYPEATAWLTTQGSHWSSCGDCRPVMDHSQVETPLGDAQPSYPPSLPA